MHRVVIDANVFISALIRPEGPPGRILERLLIKGKLVQPRPVPKLGRLKYRIK